MCVCVCVFACDHFRLSHHRIFLPLLPHCISFYLLVPPSTSLYLLLPHCISVYTLVVSLSSPCIRYAKTWMTHAYTTTGTAPHYKMSYNKVKGVGRHNGQSILRIQSRLPLVNMRDYIYQLNIQIFTHLHLGDFFNNILPIFPYFHISNISHTAGEGRGGFMVD